MDAEQQRANAATGVRAADGRQRTPEEIAAQLERDAKSLELTGAQFNEEFYRTTAANLREAAGALAGMRDRLWHAQRFVADRSVTTAQMIREAVPHREGEASTWRDACDAIANALIASRDSMPGPGGVVRS